MNFPDRKEAMSSSLQPDSVFDRSLLKLRKKRARFLENKDRKNYNFLAQKSLDELCARLLDVRRSFTRCMQIGAHAQIKDSPKFKIENLWIMDELAGDVAGDEEFIPFGHETLDLILSPSTLHRVNDLPGSLIQLRRALKPDGLFLGAMFGGETLYELRECLSLAEQDIMGGLSPRISPFADKQQMGSLMQRAGFALPVVDSDIIRVTYNDFYDLCHDLRGMGETNIITQRSRHFTPKALFDKAGQIYRERYADRNGRLEASFEIIYLTGWAPHGSQQQPLRPGSATESLADHLGTKEFKAGEKIYK